MSCVPVVLYHGPFRLLTHQFPAVEGYTYLCRLRIMKMYFIPKRHSLAYWHELGMSPGCITKDEWLFLWVVSAPHTGKERVYVNIYACVNRDYLHHNSGSNVSFYFIHKVFFSLDLMCALVYLWDTTFLLCIERKTMFGLYMDIVRTKGCYNKWACKIFQ